MRDKGWLRIPDVQDGDRTVQEQTAALRYAIEGCAGKSILDMGCAEGLVGKAFIDAGAIQYTGIESVEGHVKVARKLCAGLPMEFRHINMNDLPEGWANPADIVMCLGIAHKLIDPGKAIRIAAQSARELVLIRSGKGANAQGIIKSKHHGNTCDSHAIMMAHAFRLSRVVEGPPPHSENVEYWAKQ
jgi:SAM-dependent methyltransferase